MLRTLSILLLALHAAAQQQASCTSSGFQWATNSLGEDPCQVAVRIGQPCSPSTFVVPSITGDQSYLGPALNNATKCECSSVFYSALMVCALCQGGTQNEWTHYSQNCSTVYVPVYPTPIPPGVAIPAWAYDDVTLSNGVNLTLAQSEASEPESSAAPGPSTPPTSSNAPSKGHKNNAGAIAGGVIGGLVVIAILAGALLLFRRRRTGGRDRQTILNLNPDSPTVIDGGGSPVYMMQTPTPQKLYDPSDPSTFPTSPVMSSHTSDREQPVSSINLSYNSQRQYTGAAEI